MDARLYTQIQTIERSHWWYVARRRIVFDWLRRTIHHHARARILDIGCGTGFNIEQLMAAGFRNVVGLDLSEDALTFCRSRNLRAIVRGDATRPPFTAASFDAILALDLIEHVKDDDEALREVRRLLRPDGVLVIFTPAFQFLWSRQDEVSHHFRRYTAGELRAKLQRAGLHPVKLSYANTFLFPIVWGGRLALKFGKGGGDGVSENDLHPSWSNGVLQAIFAAERPLLRHVNLPFGVSILSVSKPQR